MWFELNMSGKDFFLLVVGIKKKKKILDLRKKHHWKGTKEHIFI